MREKHNWNDYPNFLSLGGGVQSTALLLMCLHGEIKPKLEAAIFADTGWERQGTYETIEFLTEYAKGFDVPVYTVSNGNIREDTINKGNISLPVYIRNKDNTHGMLRRQCTGYYKIAPIRKKIRELSGATYKKPVVQMIGISVDEHTRMRDSSVKYIIHRYPLVDKRMGRDSNIAWLKKNGFEIPVRSSCVGCPMIPDSAWMNRTEEEIKDASNFENKMRDTKMKYFRKYKEKYPNKLIYLHKSLQPISKRPFDNTNPAQLPLFDMESEECEGGCFL